MNVSAPPIASFEEFVWGIALIAITMAVHGLGVVGTMRVGRHLRRGSQDFLGRLWRLARLVTATWMLVVVHLFEVCFIWGAFFWSQDAFATSRDAVYYALMQYTTVGSNLSLPYHLRLLGGMVSMAGLLTFAWSTSVLIVLAQDFQKPFLDALEDEREPEGSRRSGA